MRNDQRAAQKIMWKKVKDHNFLLYTTAILPIPNYSNKKIGPEKGKQDLLMLLLI